MVSITVKIHHGFKRFVEPGMTGGAFGMSLEEGTTVGELLREKVGIADTVPMVILVNGLHAKEEHPLSDGDRVALFTPMTGG